MALPSRSVLLQLLLVSLALAAAFSHVDAARALAATLEEDEAAVAPERGQLPAAGSHAVLVELEHVVVVVDKFGGGRGGGAHFGGEAGGGHSSGDGGSGHSRGGEDGHGHSSGGEGGHSIGGSGGEGIGAEEGGTHRWFRPPFRGWRSIAAGASEVGAWMAAGAALAAALIVW